MRKQKFLTRSKLKKEIFKEINKADYEQLEKLKTEIKRKRYKW